MNDRNIISYLLSEVLKLINKKISKLKFDKTFRATVWKINDNNTYSINYKGQLYDVKNATSSSISLGQTVWVVIPSGILREMFIYGVSKNGVSSSSSVEELANSINTLQKKVENNTYQINDVTMRLDGFVSVTDDLSYEPLEN